MRRTRSAPSMTPPEAHASRLWSATHSRVAGAAGVAFLLTACGTFESGSGANADDRDSAVAGEPDVEGIDSVEASSTAKALPSLDVPSLQSRSSPNRRPVRPRDAGSADSSAVESHVRGEDAAPRITTCDGSTEDFGNRDGAADAAAADAAWSVPEHLQCQSPMPVMGPGGVDTGYVQCAGGWLHRAEKRTCPSILPRADVCEPAAFATAECATDTDCLAGPHGHCELHPATGGCRCWYGCVTDADCGPSQICVCGPMFGTCSAGALCTSDADCGGSLLCKSSSVCPPGSDQGCELSVYPADADPGCGKAFNCQTPNDTCSSNDQCSAYCTVNYPTGHACDTEMCEQ
jgi:hypothetical protein